MDEKVKKTISNFPEPQKTHVKRIREIILSASENVGETIKWNHLTYTYGKHNLCFIYSYGQADYLNLGFMNAVHLDDPKKLFEGTGKGMRHIKIRTPKDIPATQIKKWIRESIAMFEE